MKYTTIFGVLFKTFPDNIANFVFSNGYHDTFLIFFGNKKIITYE